MTPSQVARSEVRALLAELHNTTDPSRIEELHRRIKLASLDFRTGGSRGESAALSSETHYRLSPFLLWCCPWFVSAVADDSLFE